MKTVLLLSCFLALSIFRVNGSELDKKDLHYPHNAEKDVQDEDTLDYWYDDDLSDWSQSREHSDIKETNKQEKQNGAENKEETFLEEDQTIQENEKVSSQEKEEEQDINDEIFDDGMDEQNEDQDEQIDDLFRDDKYAESLIEEDSPVDDNGEAVESIVDIKQNDDEQYDPLTLEKEEMKPTDIEDESDVRVKQEINNFLDNLEGLDNDAIGDGENIKDAVKDLSDIDGLHVNSLEDLLEKIEGNKQNDDDDHNDSSPIDKLIKQYDPQLEDDDTFDDESVLPSDTDNNENKENFYNKQDDEYYNKMIKELVSSEEIINSDENDHEKPVDLNNEKSENEEELTKDNEDDFDSELNVNPYIQPEILEETKNLLDSINSEMKSEEIDSNKERSNESEASVEEYAMDEKKKNDNVNKLNEEAEEDVNEYDELVEKAVDDLQEDLNSLYKTISKLKQDVVENELISDEVIENVQEAVALSKEDDNDDFEKLNEQPVKNNSSETSVDIKAYEDKYQRPFGEDRILEIRHAIEDAYEDNKEYYVDESDLDNENIEKTNNTDAIRAIATEKVIPYISDQIFTENKADENIDETELERLVSADGKVSDSTTQEIVNVTQKVSDDGKVSSSTVQEIDDLTSSEVIDLMEKFIKDNAKDLEVDSESFNKNVAPIHITLSLDEAVEVTSPNYPSPYPTNNIIDWIFEGDNGVGIEMNLTDFSVNGFLGDYLLVKPGELDDASEDGLIFSYALKKERSFRFLDVNRMFVRFEAKLGMAFNRGFRFTAKLIRPTQEQPEPIPLPEPVINEPSETLLVFLGGVSPLQFTGIKEEFRVIVADMATLYINNNDLEMGDNTTSEVTQITRISTCNINWPNFESCTGVRLGVPLQNEDMDLGLSHEQLKEMWDLYIGIDPFASRLKRLGVNEFVMPNDNGSLAVWLVVGFGVIISASLLALALWKWTCFEDYTRMQAYSDTDSLRSEKPRGLDLYPTPHQNLPPLYDDDFIKYEDSTRVNMTGFTNSNFVRDSLLEESDDDLSSVPSVKDRFTTDV